jgi:NadR type nicotinamide-nucleotide adenylyltransferase
MAAWAFLPQVVRPWFVRRLAIVGAESTGKTMLAAHLGRVFDTEWVPEFGRAYCEDRDPRTLTLDDFDAIGRGQVAAEDSAAMLANRVLVCDTELWTTCTWSDLIIGQRPAWLEAAARGRRYDQVLLLTDDVPWVNDGTRVLGARRREHTDRLRAALTDAGQPYVELNGSFAERTASAEAAVEALLGAASFSR